MMNHYKVAEHVFGIDAPEDIFALLPNYAPFLTDEIDASHVFILHVSDEPMPVSEGWEHVYTDRSDEDMPRIEMYKRPEEWLFLSSMWRDSAIECALQCSANWREATVYLHRNNARFAIDNAAMLLYAFATANKQTLLFHSSVTVLDEKAYLFLGHSGTGKSTHSQQWKAAFADAELLNDDNPAVRVFATPRVYGTPWSGKTPCYKNASATIQALVQLVQAPENKMTPLKMSQAYPYLLASVSGLKVLPEMMDNLYESIAKLLERVPVYQLECLPNTAAAQLCCETINNP